MLRKQIITPHTASPDTTSGEIVATALNVLWIGLERVRAGETWAG